MIIWVVRHASSDIVPVIQRSCEVLAYKNFVCGGADTHTPSDNSVVGAKGCFTSLL
jgi:hypothetical protein